MVFQYSALLDSMNVLENVAFPLREHSKLKEADIRAKVADKLGILGLENTEKKFPSQLSGGMRKRVALARALMLEPEIILYDEPTSGLDPASRESFYRTIDELRAEGATILISTHALAEIEHHADRIAVMHGGRLRALGSVEELRCAAALPVRLRFTVVPCSTGRLLERLGAAAEVISRGECHLEVGCRPADKAALLRSLEDLWQLVEDVSLETPGLPAIYGRLVEAEDGQ